MERSCYNKALDLLSRRPHFRRELAAKLAGRGFEDDEVDDALDRLEAKALLDDRRTARDFVAHRLAREPLGRWRLLAELDRRGAPEGAAQEAVDAVYPDDEGALAAAAAERWRRRTARATSAALARHLERRGFTRRAIVTVLRGAADDSDEP
ncbi:MAG TPA: regulatory protein RecX [Thermoanaerobaculia bacterium]